MKSRAGTNDGPAWLGAKSDSPAGAFYWLSDHYPVDNDLFQAGQPDEHNSKTTGVMIYDTASVGLHDYAQNNKIRPFCRICPGNLLNLFGKYVAICMSRVLS